MASYPSAKVHRPSRRKLGKGQAPAAPPFSIGFVSPNSLNSSVRG